MVPLDEELAASSRLPTQALYPEGGAAQQMVTLATGSNAQLPAQQLPPHRARALPAGPVFTGRAAGMGQPHLTTRKKVGSHRARVGNS